MSKLNCPCGWQISNACSPSSWIFHLLSDEEHAKLFDDETEVKDGKLQTIDLWECTQCGRVAIGGNPVRWYTPEGERRPILA